MNEITRIITPCRCGECIYCEFGGNPPAQIIEKETVCGDCELKDALIEQQRAEIERLKRCCNCEYANHKSEVCEHPDNEPETFMDGVCDLWSHNI